MSVVHLGTVRAVAGITVNVELENLPGYQVGPLSIADELLGRLAPGDTVIVAELAGPAGDYVVLAKLATS